MLLRHRMLLRGAAGRQGKGQPRPEDAQPPETASVPPPEPADDIALLAEVGRLHEQGVLTDEEFAQEKARILGS
jgi:hypothetical protein